MAVRVGTRDVVTIVGRLPRAPRGEPHDAKFEPLAAAFGFVEQLQNSLAAGRRPFQDADATFLEDVRKAVDGALRTMSPRAPST
jgi:hypothetical protein